MPSGITLVVGIAIGALVMLIVGAVAQFGKEESEEDVLFDTNVVPTEMLLEPLKNLLAKWSGMKQAVPYDSKDAYRTAYEECIKDLSEAVVETRSMLHE